MVLLQALYRFITSILVDGGPPKDSPHLLQCKNRFMLSGLGLLSERGSLNPKP